MVLLCVGNGGQGFIKDFSTEGVQLVSPARSLPNHYDGKEFDQTISWRSD